MLLLVVHSVFFCGDERAANADAGQHPAELEAEDVKEEVDMTRKVFVPVHTALAESVVRGEVCFPDSGTFVRVAAASGASTNSGRRAGSAVASAAAENEPTTCSDTRSLKRAGVAVLSATVKTARAFAVSKSPEPSRAKDVLISRAPSTEAISLASSSVLSTTRGRTTAGPGRGRCCV